MTKTNNTKPQCPKADVYARVTARIVADLEKGTLAGGRFGLGRQRSDKAPPA